MSKPSRLIDLLLNAARVDDGTVRYVAEENISVVHEDPSAGMIAMAGQHFKRWNGTTSAFVSNIKDEYPDD